jgi:hypothetical protein
MGQLGWMQINKARQVGRAASRRSGWGDDERPAHPVRLSTRDQGAAGHLIRRVLRPGRVLTLTALVAVTIVSWFV